MNLPKHFAKKIGEGSSGRVCEYNINGKFAAAKILYQQLPKRKMLKVVHKFRTLSNRNVISLLGYSIQPCAFIFEYCHLVVYGEVVHNVSELIAILSENEYFVFSERFGIIQQATLGLKTLHEHDIVHKDFKPTNLLVSGSLSNILIKVADFDDMQEIKNTITSSVAATPYRFTGMTLTYTAPEICLQYVKSATFETDIYSWAITVYEILSGISTPWSNALALLNDALLIEALCLDKRPPVEDLYKYYNKCYVLLISPVILSCWHGSPKNRPSIDKVMYIY